MLWNRCEHSWNCGRSDLESFGAGGWPGGGESGGRREHVGFSVACMSPSRVGKVGVEGVSSRDMAGVEAGHVICGGVGDAGEGMGRRGGLSWHVGCWLCSWVCSGIEWSCRWRECLEHVLVSGAGVLVLFVRWIG